MDTFMGKMNTIFNLDDYKMYLKTIKVLCVIFLSSAFCSTLSYNYNPKHL